MKISRQNHFRGGFTLIEIMVAIAIFMMLIAVIYSTWALVMKAARKTWCCARIPS